MTRPHAPLRLGVAGLGMAGGMMVPAIVAHPRLALAGAADPSAALRERFARDHAVTVDADIATLVARPEVDAVYIATPHELHHEHALLAARHGKHILVEKPMALTLADCDAMIAAAEAAGVVLVVGHTHSFDPTVRAMRALVASGEVGRLAMISMWNFTDFLYRPRRPEELDTARGGGILFNQLPHAIDVARYLAGVPVRSVRAMAGRLDPARPTEGCASAFLDFADGSVATLVYSGYDHFDSDELNGWVGATGHPKQPAHGATRRALAALEGEAAERRLREERYGYGAGSRFSPAPPPHQSHFGIMVASCAHADLRPTPDGVRVYADAGVRDVPLPGGRSGRTEVLDELCRAVLDAAPPEHDGRFARGTLATALAVLRSARERKEVAVEEAADDATRANLPAV